jgi:hypothetical protein
MRNPLKVLADQFVRRTPTELLVFGIVVSFLDFSLLYVAAAKEGVLHINGGIGLLTNYGLFSTILGNAVFFYVARKYYDSVCSMRASNAVVKTAAIDEALSTLTSMIRMRENYQLWVYLIMIVGVIAWLLNVKSHVLDNPEIKWAHKVFDSTDHPLSFLAPRLHGLYIVLIVMPLLGHVMISTSIQLRRALRTAWWQGALRYDLLNPDQRGGFRFVDHANILSNVVAALVYLQITLHIGTFEVMNTEYVIGYVALTVLLIVMNRMFLGEIYVKIRALRIEALNDLKKNVYNDDKLSFEILKYCYERRISALTILSAAIKAAAIVIPTVLKMTGR